MGIGAGMTRRRGIRAVLEYVESGGREGSSGAGWNGDIGKD